MKLVRQTATVTGDGPFPLDMLRYDQAWPQADRDADAIAKSIETPYTDAINVTVERRAPKGHAWTLDQWNQFGYTVIHTTEDRVPA